MKYLFGITYLIVGFLVLVGITAGIFWINSSERNIFIKNDEIKHNSDDAFLSKHKKSKATVTILSFGDMMLDRAVRKRINEYGVDYPFLHLRDFLKDNDIVVANAEGPFTTHPSETIDNMDGPLTFTFDPEILPILKHLGFTLLSLANNHTLNFGSEGLRQSEQFIESAGLNWFGDPLNNDLHSFITTIRDVKIAFIGYNEFTGGGLDVVLNAVRSAKQQGAFVIVYPHWGIEYDVGMTQTQIDDAHSFIDAGADAVLGSHPHVIEPIEIYKGKAIFYSLGNFIFDQNPHGPTGVGLSVRMFVAPAYVTYSLFPFTIRHAQALLMDTGERATLLQQLSNRSNVSIHSKESIENGTIRLDR